VEGSVEGTHVPGLLNVIKLTTITNKTQAVTRRSEVVVWIFKCIPEIS
jgi:hypothetical protein